MFVTPQRRLTRRAFVTGAVGTAGAALALPSRGSAAPLGKLEKPDMRVGASVVGASFLPIYVAVDHTWKAEGLTSELINFRGDAELAQALVGDSVDVACISCDALVSLINAHAPCIGFYCGFYTAAFAWISVPSIKSWSDVKGTSVSITTYGSMTDQFARYMMTKHGLEPLKDVQIVQGGPPASMFQLLKSGRTQGSLLAPPYVAMAKAEGFSVLATEAGEVAAQWPNEVFVAKTKFIEDNPNTLKALLRAHVAASRLSSTDPAVAIAALVDRLKITPPIAKATYDEIMPSLDEKGLLPSKANMDVFWAVEQKNGKVTERWPDAKILDDRFIKTFSSWAP
jgi:NitT/TauT family transport system substrate-binding protein